MPTNFEVNFRIEHKKKPRSLVQANKTVTVPAVPSSVIRGRPTSKTERDISDAAHVALNPKRYMRQAFGDGDSKTIRTRIGVAGTGLPGDPMLGFETAPPSPPPMTTRSFHELRVFAAAEERYKQLLSTEDPSVQDQIAAMRAELEVIDAKEKLDLALRIRSGGGRGGMSSSSSSSSSSNSTTTTTTTTAGYAGRLSYNPLSSSRIGGGGGGRSSPPHFYNKLIPPEITQKVRALQRVEREVTKLAMSTMTFDSLEKRGPALPRRNRKKRTNSGGSPNARRRRQRTINPDNLRDNSKNQFLRGSDRRHTVRRSRREASAAKIQARIRGRQARKNFQAQQGERHEATRKIQAIHRGRAARRERQERHEATRKIQAIHRGRSGRRALTQRQHARQREQELDAASRKIQSLHRGRRTRVEQEEKRRATLKIQSLHRGRQSRKQNKTKPSPRLSTTALRSGLRLLFDEADLNQDGAIDAEELKELIIELPKQYNVSPKLIPLLSEAGQVMRALDKDGNGEIDYEEWEDWIMSNRELTYAQRQEFAARSALHARFDLFVQAIVRVAAGKVHRLGGISKEALCAGLKLLFDEADLDNNKSIDVDELRSLLVELPRRYNANPDDIPTSSDADLVMSALDADGDGHVDYEEWEEWVVSNRTMTEADISSFASISPTHGRLNRFVESIVKIASDKMRRLGGDQLLRGLRMMFEEFDTDENGSIDMDELRAMMTAIPYVYTLDVKNAPKPDADSAAVMAALDRDGNGSIDFAEFRDWILAYRDMSSERQKDFAARSQQHARLNWFACAIVTISLDEAGHEKKVEPFAEDHTFSAANLPTQDGYEYDYDDEMEAASEKIQAVQRGRRVRREQEERRRATLKIQALHRGRRARQQNRIIGTQKSQDLFSAPSFDQQNKETFCAGLRLVFSEADLDRSDSIDLDELQTLMLELPHRYNVDPGTIPLPQDTGVVMSALDADGNGRVDFSEWQDWVLSNRALSPEDRALLTARSEVHNRLDKFVETISMIASLKMSRLGGDVLISGLNVVFKEFDTDGDGILDMDELRALVIAIPAMYQDDNEHAPLPRDVGRIMDALDRDASGGVDYAEFRDWILTNLDLNDVERENLTARSEELKRLDWFARAIASIAREMAPEHEEATEDEKLSGEY